MHYKKLFLTEIWKIFRGGGCRRLDRRAFGAPHLALSALGFMRPVFSVPIVGNPNCD